MPLDAPPPTKPVALSASIDAGHTVATMHYDQPIKDVALRHNNWHCFDGDHSQRILDVRVDGSDIRVSIADNVVAPIPGYLSYVGEPPDVQGLTGLYAKDCRHDFSDPKARTSAPVPPVIC